MYLYEDVDPPSCLDSAYERLAVLQKMSITPVFPENKKYVKEYNENINQK